MDFSSVKNIKILLKKYNLSPRKELGQNFLIDANILRKIINAADLNSNGLVLEVGPGLGFLTLELAKNSKKVIAVEKDEKMAEILKDILKEQNIKNVEIIKADILKIKHGPMAKWLNGYDYKVVANLPYYITAPVIRKFLENENKPGEMILMVQKEVAQRICAKPPKMNLLAVSVQFYAKPEIVSFVSKKSFWPQPKVDSAIIRINPRIHTDKKTDSHRFFQIVRAGFSQPRKQILNNLSKKLELNKQEVISWLTANKINPERRAETLTLNDWIRLCSAF